MFHFYCKDGSKITDREYQLTKRRFELTVFPNAKSIICFPDIFNKVCSQKVTRMEEHVILKRMMMSY